MHVAAETVKRREHPTVSISEDVNSVGDGARHRLKEPFYRVDQARNLDQDGAGLAMSIVDNLARAEGREWSIYNGTSA